MWFNGSAKEGHMDVTQAAEGLLKLMEQRQALGDELAKLEEVIRDAALEVGAKALELHLSRRKLGYEGSQRPCECGATQRFIAHRPKQVATLLGDVTIRRAYYRCDRCRRSCLPYDQRIGLGPVAASPALAQAATLCAVQEPFGVAEKMLHLLSGRRLSRSTIHRYAQRAGATAQQREQLSDSATQASKASPALLHAAVDGVLVHVDGQWREIKVATCYFDDPSHRRDDRVSRYVARGEPAEAFAPFVEALAKRCGLERAGRKALLGDGAAWIWDRVAPVLGPGTTFITDWYHVMQHVWQCGHALHGEGTPAARDWVKPLETILWNGQLRQMRSSLQEQIEAAGTTEHREALESLRTYLVNQGDRLVYDDFRAAGLDIGSGRVESACKHLVANRAKRSGMHWSAAGVQHMLSLRSAYINEDWSAVWARKPLARHLRN
jgi:hypothetical protein